jgi:hypothetical protein
MSENDQNPVQPTPAPYGADSHGSPVEDQPNTDPTPARPPRSRRGVLLAAIGGLVVLAGVAVVVVLQNRTSSDEGAPGDVVLELMAAGNAHSCDRMAAVMTAKLVEQIGFAECEDSSLEGQSMDMKVTDVKISGDKATVTISGTTTAGGETHPSGGVATLVKEDGEWKIDSLSESGGDAGEGQPGTDSENPASD